MTGPNEKKLVKLRRTRSTRRGGCTLILSLTAKASLVYKHNIHESAQAIIALSHSLHSTHTTYITHLKRENSKQKYSLGVDTVRGRNVN